MIEFPFSDRIPGAAELAQGGWDLSVDVSGTPGEVAYRVWQGRTSSEIWMAAEAGKRAFVNPSVPAGAWHFGLWYFDCAELFLACSSTGRYLEVNLAPNGAYWIGVFSAPRRQDLAVRAETWPVSTTGAILPHRWAASIALPWASVVEALGGEPDRGNVTAVLDGCPDEDVPPANLRSLVPIDPFSPDFHIPDRFVPVSILR